MPFRRDIAPNLVFPVNDHPIPAKAVVLLIDVVLGLALLTAKQFTHPVDGLTRSIETGPPCYRHRYRVDAGLPGLEFEAHGRIASAVKENTGKACALHKKTGFEPSRLGFVKLVDSSPTGC
jgi:hypothetical protein